jgi:hypothetical protein
VNSSVATHSNSITSIPSTIQPARFPAGSDNLCAPLLRQHSPPPGIGPLPRSSTVTAARWCIEVFTAHGPRVQLRQATGDLTALNEALHAPRAAPLPPTVGCPAVAYAVIILEVLDQHGRLLRPTVPTSQCGDPAGTRDALAVTAYSVVSSQAPGG